MLNSLLLFSIMTAIFATLKYLTRGQPAIQSIMGLIYIFSVMGLQFYVNFTSIQDKCGGKGDYGTAFFNTILPFVLIFIVIFYTLKAFPSFKAPFSNTFGYGLTRLMGVRTLLLKDILKLPVESGQDGPLNASLRLIYEDPSLLINSITPDTMEAFIERSAELFKPDIDQYITKLYDLVRLKDIVAEYMWYYLSGLLVTAYSISNIATLKCDVSSSDMIKLHRLHVDNHKQDISTDNNNNKDTYILNE